MTDRHIPGDADLNYFTVTCHLAPIVADVSQDSDYDPNTARIDAVVTFTPKYKTGEVIHSHTSTPPTGFLALPVTALIDDGYLKLRTKADLGAAPLPGTLHGLKAKIAADTGKELPVETDLRALNYAPVRLLGNSASLEIDPEKPLYYDFSFSNIKIDGKVTNLTITGGTFEAPWEDTLIDLLDYMPLTPGPFAGPMVVGPQGPQGEPGPATIDVGSTTTSAPGSDASVSNVGDTVNAVLDFVIPRGDVGPPGPAGGLLEFDSAAVFPAAGEAGYAYLAKDTGDTYRWDPLAKAPTYVRISERVKSTGIEDSSVVGRDLVTAADELAARAAISATSSVTVTTAESLGIPCDGVTDAAPFINALPAETGIIHFSGTMLCKTPLTIPHGVTLKGKGRATNIAGASIILFDNTATWGASPNLLTLGVGANICFATRVVDAVIDAADIPGSIAVYSKCANEQSGLQNVLVRRAMSKGVYVDMSQFPVAQNWGLQDIEIIMSELADPNCIGIDVFGGGTNMRGLNGITITNRGKAHIVGMTGIRLNGVFGGAVRDVHVEYLETGVLLGDTHAVTGVTVQNVNAYSSIVDVVRIETPRVGNVHNINVESLTAATGATNLVNDVPRGTAYKNSANANSCGYYRLGSGTDAAMPVDTNLVGASSNVHRATEKVTPVDADEIGLIDSAASWVLKRFTWASLKAAIASATMTMTNKTLTSARVNQICDINGAVALGIAPTTNAVNYVLTQNTAGTTGPLLRSAGTPNDVQLNLGTKGVANIVMQDGNGATTFSALPTAGATTFVRVANAVTGSAPSVQSMSTDQLADVSLNLTSRYLGVVQANGVQVETKGHTHTVAQVTGAAAWITTPPTSATAPGTAGQMCHAGGLLYTCVATNTWVWVKTSNTWPPA